MGHDQLRDRDRRLVVTVTVATDVPWASLPATLYLNGRGGIAAPEQIADTASES